MGMQVGEIDLSGKPPLAAGAQRIVDDPNQGMIPFVEK
jgi:hypothetical protein